MPWSREGRWPRLAAWFLSMLALVFLCGSGWGFSRSAKANGLTSEADGMPRKADDPARYNRYFYVDLAGITDPNGHTYGLTYAFDHTRANYMYQDYYKGWYYPSGIPRQITSVTGPDGSVAHFGNSSKVWLGHDAETGELQAAGNRTLSVTDVCGGEWGYAFGQSSVVTMDAVKLSGGQYDREMTSGQSLAHAVDATSSFGGGQPDTTASILSGTASAATRLASSFSGSSSALNDETRFSDVYALSGVPVVSMLTDVFMLQLAVSSVSAASFLGWLDTETNTWVNAVDGNIEERRIFTAERMPGRGREATGWIRRTGPCGRC